MKTLALLLLATAALASGKRFGNRQPLFECENGEKGFLRYFERLEKKGIPAGLSYSLDGKVRDVDLASSQTEGTSVQSNIFRFEGFTKIVLETERRDLRKRTSKKEQLKVLIDPVAGDLTDRKFTATLELFADNLEQPVAKQTFSCVKKP